MDKWRIRRGDEVIVLTGKDKGKSGKIISVLRERKRVVVEGVNIVKKHQRPSAANPSGGIIEKAASIDASNVALLDPSTKKPTRVGYKILEDGRKVRYSKRSGEQIDV